MNEVLIHWPHRRSTRCRTGCDWLEAARAAGLSGALDATLPEDATDADVQERCDVVLALAEAVPA